MAFAKAEALTMVCMKNRFWTLIAKVRQTNPGAGHLCGREPVRAGVSAGYCLGQMKKAAALE